MVVAAAVLRSPVRDLDHVGRVGGAGRGRGVVVVLGGQEPPLGQETLLLLVAALLTAQIRGAGVVAGTCSTQIRYTSLLFTVFLLCL